MTARNFLVFVACLCFLSVLSPSVEAGILSRKNTRVFIQSEASPEYLKSRQQNGGLRPETYHFIKGKNYEGFTVDKTLDKVTFQQMMETLAEQLKTQNYTPERERSEGDLLIVVHWGRTKVNEDLDDLSLDSETQDGPDNGDASSGSEQSNVQKMTLYDSEMFKDKGRSTVSLDQENAKLLGFDKALRKKNYWASDEEVLLRTALRKERYFIILMAYDLPKIRSGGPKTLLWTTRFSLDSTGLGFEDAHLSLARAAAPYYGVNLKTLAKSKTHIGRGTVEHGDLEVVESAVSE